MPDLTFYLLDANMSFKPNGASWVMHEKASCVMFVSDAISDMSEQVNFAVILNTLAECWIEQGSPRSGPLLTADAKRMCIGLMGETARVQLAALDRRN